MQTSFQVSDKLFLVRQTIETKAVAKPVEVPTNHLIVIDCSGSMYSELPKIREQLKKKMPKLLKDTDTVSIIWFSGKSQFGTLLEAEPVSTLTDLQAVNGAIDRWLKPVSLTGFKEPLEEAAEVVERVAKKRPGSAFSLWFMSDGCDNVWPRAEILKAVEKAAGGIAAATFVEYGYYADRPLLTAMAEKAGGSLIFAQHFDTYSPAFEACLQKKLVGGKKIEITVEGSPVGGFAYAISRNENGVDGDFNTFAVEDGKANISEGVSTVYSVSPTPVGTLVNAYEVEAAYAAISLFSVRMLPDVVLPFLKLTGDVAFISKFSGLYGKQRYSEFMDAAKAATFNPKLRLLQGYDPNKVPADDAFTVLDLLQLLSGDDGNKLLLDHPEFKYQRIGRARVDSSANLTSDEQAEVTKLTEEMSKSKNAAKIGELASKIAALTAGKQEALKFVEDKTAAEAGYSISNLTYNEEKPNISVLIRKTGTVDLTARIPDSLKGKVPATFSTFIFRNYAIVKDGLVNVEKLPVKLTKKTFDRISSYVEHKVESILSEPTAPDCMVTCVLDLSSLPIINRKMVKACSAKNLFEMEWQLTKVRAAQKVFNAVKKEKFPRKAEGFEMLYGPEAATWLKEQGFTDYSGFGPKTVQGEAKDFYMAKELGISIKGYSSIPSMNEFKKQAAKGKLTPSAQLMAPAIKEVEDFLASDVYKQAANPDKLFETWLDGKAHHAAIETRRLIGEKARILFSIIVGQIWFTEFSSLDESTMDLTVDGVKLACKADLKEVRIDI